MEELKCPICGEPTSIYMGNARKDRLCRKHAKELKDGLIILCENCGKYHEPFVACNSKCLKNKDTFCVTCGKASKYKQCKDCYNETRNFIDSLDKNATITENRNYYYNLKDFTFRRGNIESVMSNCNKMIAIAINNSNNNNDDSLINKVYKDVEDMNNKKKASFEQQEKAKNSDKTTTTTHTPSLIEENRDNIVYLKYSEDGHALDSEMEIKIDDILYSSEILHCCHKPITEILSQNKTSDWFIPIEGINKGIYIEYWGMDTPKYIASKKEKIQLYIKYDVPFIEIQKDDPKNNTQLFKANLIKEITKKAEQYFNKMPKWTKNYDR